MLSDLGAYIPQDRRHALERGVDLPDRATGAAMFADVTGFTQLAEALVRARGPRRGAEDLTALLNQVYGALITQVERFGGSVISFSGDAMTCWFDDTEKLGAGGWRLANLSPASTSLRAVACGLAMRAAMQQFAAIDMPGGPAALHVKIALTGGVVRRFLIGDPHFQILDVLAGRTLDRLAASAQLAERDDVVADPQTLAMIAPEVQIARWRDDAQTGARAGAIGALKVQVAPAPWPALREHAFDAERAGAWLLPAALERLRGSTDMFVAELRPAVALMLQFGGIDYDQDGAGARLDQYVRQVQQIVARYEGALIDVTMADKGGYLYIAFGAPIAHEDDPARALRAALDLRDLPVVPGGEGVRIGLSQGTARTGPYGGVSRRTYGVLGDEVNLACRLMSAAAAGQIVASGRLQAALSGAFDWQILPAMRVRGKQAPIDVYRLLGEATTATYQPARAPSELIGRTAERAALDEAAAALLAGSGGVVVIEGEPGIGKSRLVAALVERLDAQNITSLAGAGRSIEAQTPYRAWRDVFAAYFGLEDGDDLAKRRAQVYALVASALPAQLDRLPLLNDLFNLGLADTALTSSLAGSLRGENLGALLVDLLRARAAERPLALVIEDVHWLDSRSWWLAARVARVVGAERLGILLVVATRRLEPGHVGTPHLRALLEVPGARWLRLDRLPEHDTVALAAMQLGLDAADMPKPVAALVRARAGGNPFFAEELAAMLRAVGLIQIESPDPPARARCVVTGDLAQADRLLPDTLHGLLLARIDQLPPEQQMALKVAAAIGPMFSFRPLHFARSRQSAIEAAELKAQLRSLAAQDYTWLEEPEPNLAYRFKHILTQAAAYETLLYAQRRTLHRDVAEWYEQAYGSSEFEVMSFEFDLKPSFNSELKTHNSRLRPYYPLLAHHYRQAEDSARERHYAWLAGIQAAEQYANAEAVAFFTRTLELTPADDLAARYAALFEREAAEELLAAREDQARDLAELEVLAEALDDNVKRAEVARNQARYAERVGKTGDMRALATRAVVLAEAAGASELAIEAYDQWAWACMRNGDYREACERAEAGLRIARTTADRRNEAQMLVALGCAHAEIEERATAQRYLEQGLHIFRELGRQRGASVALGNLGEVAAQQGDYAAARAHFEQALQLYRTTGDRRNEGWALGNLGIIAMQLGDYAAARVYHEQARDTARATGDRNTESLALTDLALIAHQLADHTTALDLGTQSSAIATVVFTRIRALLVLGHALLELGRAPEARANYTAARELAQAAALRAKTAEASAGLARVVLASGDTGGALASIESLVEQVRHETFGGADEPLRIFLTCFLVLRAAGDPRAATVLAAGQALLRTRADAIPGAAARRVYLEQVPHHRELMSAES